MERWAWKILCALVSLVVSVVSSLLPFQFINLTSPTKSLKKKEDEVKLQNNSFVQQSGGSEETPSVEKAKVSEEKNLEKLQIIEKRNVEGGGEEEEFGFLRVLMCFSGGVFMGTFLLHILPEVKTILSRHLDTHHIKYPVPEVLVGAGFFLILFIDLLVAMVREKWKETETGDRGKNENAALVQDEKDLYHSIGNNNEYKQSEKIPIVSTTTNTQTSPTNAETSDKNSQNVPQPHQNSTKPPAILPTKAPGPTRAIALVIALSLHHIFEGLAIGLQAEISSLGSLTLAVLLHEMVICFSLGLQFFKQDSKLSRLTLIILTTSASIMPLGIIIGTTLSEVNNDEDDGGSTTQHILNGVLQALSCGTFIYVTFFEIIFENLLKGKQVNDTHQATNADLLTAQPITQSISPQLNSQKSPLIHHHHNHHGVNTTDLLRGNLALFLGFVFMALLALISDHHHHPHHHHHPDK